MTPFELCPVCQVSVRWALHDGGNDYDCSNKGCPIHFSEYVGFDKNEKDFSLKNGLLLHYSFKIDEYNIAVYYEEDNLEIGSFIRINLAGTNKRDFLPPFPINWHNLDSMKQKIKTLLTFS